MSTKKFRLTIDIKAIIHDKIPMKLIESLVKEVDKNNQLLIDLPKTEKHQAVIDFIKNNETFHEKSIAADLCFKINHDGIEDDLDELLNPRLFDNVALDASREMDSEIKGFITLLYKKADAKSVDEKIDEDGKPLPHRLSMKDSLEAIKREIDRRIIQDSLLDYKITGASLKAVKNGAQKLE
ncbi:MAG: hypothetical protein NT166_14985 [Candidatus Aminicenantes bacterium]|nr:hypothetical protein [Candidatus Aminicenantes bacterium]